MKEQTTLIELPDLHAGDSKAYLHCVTRKPFAGGLVSSAYVGYARNGMVTYMPMSDFNTRVVHDPGARATEKNIREQHARAFSAENIGLLKSRALHFYAMKTLTEKRSA